MNALADRRRQLGAHSAHLGQHLGALRVVGDRSDAGPGEQQMRGVVVGVLGKALQDAGRVLERVPARDLDDQRGIAGDRGVLIDLGGPVDPTRRPVEALERGRRPVACAEPRPARARIAATVSVVSSWFLGEKASIEGATIQIRSSASPAQTCSRRENT